MSSCEKCWRDAAVKAADHGKVTLEYGRLIDDRRGSPCTPEEQAGDEATRCDHCDRLTRHQYTGECMACGDPGPLDRHLDDWPWEAVR